MFKWLSAITGVLALAGGVILGVGASPVSFFTSVCVVAVLAVVSGVSIATHLLLNNNSVTTPDRVPTRTNPLLTQLEEVAEQGVSAAAEAVFELAQSHQLGQNGHEKNVNEAFNCYITAARSGHPDALTPLDRLGDEMSAEKQLELSHMYGTFFHNQERADYWRNKAAEVADFNFNM